MFFETRHDDRAVISFHIKKRIILMFGRKNLTVPCKVQMPILRRNGLRCEFFATQAQNRGVELPSSTVLRAFHGMVGITTTPLYLADHGGPCIVWLRILVVPHTQRNATHPAS